MGKCIYSEEQIKQTLRKLPLLCSLKWRPVVDSKDIDGYICVLFEEDMLFLKRLWGWWSKKSTLKELNFGTLDVSGTLPPDYRTLLFKWNTKLGHIWKEDFGPLGNSQVLLLLSPGKTPLTTTVAKFLDSSVCSGSWCLDPRLSPFLVKFQILESILLDNPHKAAVLSDGCASFSSTLFGKCYFKFVYQTKILSQVSESG